MKVTRIPPPIQPAYIQIEMTEAEAKKLYYGLGNVSHGYREGQSLAELFTALGREIK